jgi:hypothetical protein
MAQGRGRDHVNVATEEFLYIHLEGAQVEKAAAGLKVDKEVHVTLKGRVSPDDRTKKADVTHPVLRSDAEDLRTTLPYLLQGGDVAADAAVGLPYHASSLVAAVRYGVDIRNSPFGPQAS